MSKEVAMRLLNYDVNHLIFKKNNDYNRSDNEKMNAKPSFTIECLGADDDSQQYMIRLGCSVFDNPEKNNYPFACKVQVSGIFEILDIDNKDALLRYNAVAILLPYVRTLISQITAMAEVPTLHIPILNVYELQDNARDIIPDTK